MYVLKYVLEEVQSKVFSLFVSPLGLLVNSKYYWELWNVSHAYESARSLGNCVSVTPIASELACLESEVFYVGLSQMLDGW